MFKKVEKRREFLLLKHNRHANARHQTTLDTNLGGGLGIRPMKLLFVSFFEFFRYLKAKTSQKKLFDLKFLFVNNLSLIVLL